MRSSKNANKILAVWMDACHANYPAAYNDWIVGNRHYIWALSNKEYADGAVTGTIMRLCIGGPKPSSSFRIDGDGTVVRAPSFLRKASRQLEAELALEAMALNSRRNE